MHFKGVFNNLTKIRTVIHSPMPTDEFSLNLKCVKPFLRRETITIIGETSLKE